MRKSSSPKTRLGLNEKILEKPTRNDAFVGTIEEYKEFFLKKVSKTDTCWLWTGTRTNFGHGIVVPRKNRYTAHQLSYLLFNGDINDNFVLHKCDNPPCVNPEHLFLGSQGDNVRDCINKDRRITVVPLGENNHLSSLKNDDILEIRLLDKNKTLSRKNIAKKFNISLTHVYRIVNRDCWKHI